MPSKQGFREDSLRVKSIKISNLRWFFFSALVLQFMFYLFQFVMFQAEALNSTTFVVILVVGGLIFGVQLAHARRYFKIRERTVFHIEVLFIPSIVCLISTFVYFTGIFTMLFKSAGMGVWEDAIGELEALPLTVFIITTIIFFPFLFVQMRVAGIHYKCFYFQSSFSLVWATKSQPENPPQSDVESGEHSEDKLLEEDDYNSDVERNPWTEPKPPQLRMLFMISYALQVLFFIMMFVALQGVGGRSTTFVIILVVGGIFLGTQLTQARNYFKMVVSPIWHAQVIFLPSIVAWIMTMTYFSGNFTQFFQAANIGMWEDAISGLSPTGKAVFSLNTIFIVPLLIIECIIGHIHYRCIAIKIERDHKISLAEDLATYAPLPAPVQPVEEKDDPKPPSSTENSTDKDDKAEIEQTNDEGVTQDKDEEKPEPESSDVTMTQASNDTKEGDVENNSTQI